MSELPTIEEIKQQLRHGIELAEKATDGPWIKGWNAIGDGKAVTVCLAQMRHETLTSFEWPPNASFIATSRTLCPAACRGLFFIIRQLEDYTIPGTDWALSSFASEQLEEIRHTWNQ